MDFKRVARKLVFAGLLLFSSFAGAEESEVVYDTPDALRNGFLKAEELQSDGNYFAAATKFFNIYTAESSYRTAALGRVAENLIKAKLPNAATYFYIKTLQSGDRTAIRRVLNYLPEMLDAVGIDLLRKYIIHNTSEADYDSDTRNHFYYFSGKEDLLKDNPSRALQALQRVSSGSGILARAAYLRGVAQAMLGQPQNAVSSFRSCQRMAGSSRSQVRGLSKESEDLEARCTASLARTYYQMGNFEEAEEVYEEIPKASFVWTDILFEQAWNAYAKKDFNRALGKLVTYRSPSLNFVFNPEVDTLRAQSFLGLCLYDDVNQSVNEFNRKYSGVGGRIKNFLLSNDRNFSSFYGAAKKIYHTKLHTDDMFYKAMNRFIRGPYFASLLANERATRREVQRIYSLAQRETPRQGFQTGFGGFITKVVQWRLRTIHLLGGVFVRNALYDQYQDLLVNLDKMSFIKLEMLNQTKYKIEKKLSMSRDEEGVLKRGNASIDRKDHQYLWSFNGEFWIDELGDYVFALDSACGS